MKNVSIMLLVSCLFSITTKAQEVYITGGQISGGGTALGNYKYVANESIYTAAEIGVNNFTTANAPINRLAFHVMHAWQNIGQPFTNVKIYFKDVPLATTTFTSGTYTTAGYTEVFNGSVVIPGTGWTEIALTTPYVRTPGTNLQMLIERTSPTSAIPVYSWTFSYGNNTNTSLFTTRQYDSDSDALSSTTNLVASNRRQAIFFKHHEVDDAALCCLVVPKTTCQNAPQTVSATLFNYGLNTIEPDSAIVTLNVTGANNSTRTVKNTEAILPGESIQISFNEVGLSNPGTNEFNAYVTVPGDHNNPNDAISTTNKTASIIRSFPFTEKFENADLDFGYIYRDDPFGVEIRVQTGDYTNEDLGGTLTPKSNNKMMIFDHHASFGFSMPWDVTRLYSNCISIPSNNAGQCGSYQLRFWMSHDASFPAISNRLYVSISADGGDTWTRLNPGYSRYNASFTQPGWKKEVVDLSAYAGQTIQIGFESVTDSEGGGFENGNIIALDDIEIGSFASGGVELSDASNNDISLQKSCNDQGWTYYVDPSQPNQPLLAVEWDPATTGANAAAKIAAIPKIQLDPTFFSSTDVATRKATFTMKRYWNVNLNGSTLTAPVNIRFFYHSTDIEEVNTAAQNFANLHAQTVETPIWFKTVHIPFLPNATHIIPDLIYDAIPLIDANTSGATINGVLYAQFNGLTGFSGGTYATGVGNNSPLPIKLVYFRGSNQGNTHLLDWQVSSIATQYITLILEQSKDGSQFNAIYTIKENAERGQLPFRYSNSRILNGRNFYRLKLIDDYGVIQYSNVITLLDATAPLELINLAPNPITGNQFKLNLHAAEAMKIDVFVTDLAGRVVRHQKVSTQVGFNAISVDVTMLNSGTYQVYGVHTHGRTKVLRLVKQQKNN